MEGKVVCDLGSQTLMWESREELVKMQTPTTTGWCSRSGVESENVHFQQDAVACLTATRGAGRASGVFLPSCRSSMMSLGSGWCSQRVAMRFNPPTFLAGPRAVTQDRSKQLGFCTGARWHSHDAGVTPTTRKKYECVPSAVSSLSEIWGY